MEGSYSYLETNYSRVREKLEESCRKAGRAASDVRLMAVSKMQPLDKINTLYALGQRLFGENRIQEASLKVPVLPGDCEIHMIGHLQSNKAKAAAGLFHTLQSLDSLSTARALDKALRSPEGAPGKQTFPVLLEFNTSEEASKDGVRTWEELLALTEGVMSLDTLEIRGLMTMAPFTTEEGRIRPCFRQLFELRERLKTRTGLPLPVLSMGMSNDFTLAVEEGSTLVRVGTLLFEEPKL